MANTGPAKGTLFGANWGCDHLMRLVNNHAGLLLGLAFVARTFMVRVQSAVRVGAGSLDIHQLSLTDAQDREQALNARAVRLEGLCFGIFHVRRHSLYFL